MKYLKNIHLQLNIKIEKTNFLAKINNNGKIFFNWFKW